MTLEEQVAALTVQTASLLAAINLQKSYLDKAVTDASASASAAAGTTFQIAKLSDLTPNIGILRTATTGGRMEILDNAIKIFDANNVLRYQVGDLTL